MAVEFEIRRENMLPATPEQIWAAVATSPGNLGWLYPIEIEPWVGGTVSCGPSTVTVWDPPWRFACRHDSEDGLCAMLEYRIEVHDGASGDGDSGEGGSSVLHVVIRRVHRGIVGAEWKTQIDAAAQHTDFHHHTLEQYLRYFNGRPATFLQANGPAASARPNAFTVLRRGLGISDDVSRGDAVRIAVPGLNPLDAMVDYLSPQFLGLRADDGLYRFFGRNAWGSPLGLSHHLFADGIDQKKTEQIWQRWLDGMFA